MDFKLECMSERVSKSANERWPASTIQLKSALICFNVTATQLADIQEHTRAHTVDLSDYDKERINVRERNQNWNRS